MQKKKKRFLGFIFVKILKDWILQFFFTYLKDYDIFEKNRKKEAYFLIFTGRKTKQPFPSRQSKREGGEERETVVIEYGAEVVFGTFMCVNTHSIQ